MSDKILMKVGSIGFTTDISVEFFAIGKNRVSFISPSAEEEDDADCIRYPSVLRDLLIYFSEMENNQVQICKLCLEICENGFETIDGTVRDTLNSLLPSVDLDVSIAPVICTDCVGNLKKCFDFKTDFLHRQGYPFIEDKDSVLTDPRMCLGENVVDTSMDVSCSFCTRVINYNSAGFLLTEEHNIVMLLEKYFPELVQNLSVDSTACIACYQSLQKQLAFLNKCLVVEERIKVYCKVEKTDSKGEVVLSNILNLMTNNQLQNNHHNLHAEDFQNQMDGGDKIKVEDLVEIEEQELQYEDCKDIKIETEQDDSDRNDASGTKPENLHLPILKNVLEIMYKCKMCTYHSKRKGDLARHALTHKSLSEVTMYKCDFCTYQSKYKSDLPRHLLTHKNISEVTTYKCEVCAYQTRHKRHLHRHRLTHKSMLEVALYKCEKCPFLTTYKSNLLLHKQTHKDISEVAKYKCETCGFQTKVNRNMQQHILTHKSISEVTAYKCEICEFQSKYEICMKRHKLLHKNPSEVTMHKCETCDFQTRYKSNLRQHMRVHKDASEIITYKCEICDKQVKRKYDLLRHMLTHKSPLDAVYKCDECDFYTKRKRNLSFHKLAHEDPSEGPIYKCEMCVYQGKCKRNLLNHMLSHRSPEEVTLYKCSMCSYQARRKSYLSEHMLVHKSLSEIQTFKCEKCSYQGKRKRDVSRHMLVHSDRREVTI